MDQARPIPKGNFAAEDIHDVYDPAEIIGPEILDAIPVRDWQEKHKKNENIQVSSRFVAHRVNREASRQDAVQRLRILRYLLFLVIFWHLTRRGSSAGVRNIGKREKLRELMKPAPEPVIESIRRKFSVNGEMRKLQVDLLMTHCCVLACVLDEFETDTFDLREDLKQEEKDMNKYYAEIGARVELRKVAGNKHRIARLALPLRLPTVRQPKRRR